MQEALAWHSEKITQATLNSLKKNGFKAFYVPTKSEASERILEMIPANATVGVGGSVTLRELELVQALVERGNSVADHWRPGLSKEKLHQMRLIQLTSDVFLSSTNAITTDGKLLNADGAGNRVASMIFGPRKVIIVAGVNKIVRNAAEGLKRIRTVAAPMNAKRLRRDTPCGTTGICAKDQCGQPERLCNVITVIEGKPTETDITVVLVGERLGY
jgi:L-lactate utilization protein LutB